MSIFLPKNILLFTIVLIALICTVSCDDEGPRIIPPCEGDPSFGNKMQVNNTPRVIADSFIFLADMPTTANVRRLQVIGFTNDCNQREVLDLNIVLNSPGVITGTFTVTQDNNPGPGTVFGSLESQFLETLTQSTTELSSGTVTIAELGDPFFSLVFDLTTIDGDNITGRVADLIP